MLSFSHKYLNALFKISLWIHTIIRHSSLCCLWPQISKCLLDNLLTDCPVENNGITVPCFIYFLPLSPPGWRGIVVTVRAGGRVGGWAGGRAGGCQTCGTHISVTAWWIFSIRSSVELSRPVGVHCNVHMPICPIWACPWAKNLSNLPQIGSRLCGTHISETAGWIYPI